MITAMSREAFVADAWQVVGRKVSKERLLSDVYATAAGSVGLPVSPDSDAVRMFRLMLAEAWFASATRSRRGPSSFCAIIPIISF